MFDTVKNNLVRNKYVKLLTTIVAGTASAAGCAMIAEKDADGMAASDGSLVELNKAITKDGTVAVRATAAGIAAVAANAASIAAAAAAPPAAPKETPVYELQTGYAVPAIKRGGQKLDLYPFDKMEVGQSFFVAATEARPNPAKALASTVSGATKRFKGKGDRKFTVRARAAGVENETENGARIYRTA